MKIGILTACVVTVSTLCGCAVPAPGTTTLATDLEGYWQFNGDGADSSPRGRFDVRRRQQRFYDPGVGEFRQHRQ